MSQPTVAILGASSDRSKFGNKSLRAHQQAGYEVFPVNPRGGEIEGLTVYRSLTDIPAALDRISLYLPPQVTAGLLDEIAAKGCNELYFNPGSESQELIERARLLGLNPIRSCSIVDLGMRPSDFGQ